MSLYALIHEDKTIVSFNDNIYYWPKSLAVKWLEHDENIRYHYSFKMPDCIPHDHFNKYLFQLLAIQDSIVPEASLETLGIVLRRWSLGAIILEFIYDNVKTYPEVLINTIVNKTYGSVIKKYEHAPGIHKSLKVLRKIPDKFQDICISALISENLLEHEVDTWIKDPKNIACAEKMSFYIS